MNIVKKSLTVMTLAILFTSSIALAKDVGITITAQACFEILYLGLNAFDG